MIALVQTVVAVWLAISVFGLVAHWFECRAFDKRQPPFGEHLPDVDREALRQAIERRKRR